MTKITYTYPDNSDRLTLRMIESIADPQEWNDDEQRMLLRLAELTLGQSSPRSILDIGAGEGRLLTQLHAYFNSGSFVEPDDTRRQVLQNLCDAAGYSHRGFKIHSSLDEVAATEKFSTVVISHVIQHIPEAEIEVLLSKAAQLLKPGGLLYLATCLSSSSADQYSVNQWDDSGEWEELYVDRAEFERLSSQSVEGKLPVHFFPVGELAKLADLAELRVSEISAFHVRAEEQTRQQRFRDVALFATKL